MTRIPSPLLALAALAAAVLGLLAALGPSAAAPVLALSAAAGLHLHHRACLARERTPRPAPVRRD